MSALRSLLELAEHGSWGATLLFVVCASGLSLELVLVPRARAALRAAGAVAGTSGRAAAQARRWQLVGAAVTPLVVLAATLVLVGSARGELAELKLVARQSHGELGMRIALAWALEHAALPAGLLCCALLAPLAFVNVALLWAARSVPSVGQSGKKGAGPEGALGAGTSVAAGLLAWLGVAPLLCGLWWATRSRALGIADAAVLPISDKLSHIDGVLRETRALEDTAFGLSCVTLPLAGLLLAALALRRERAHPSASRPSAAGTERRRYLLAVALLAGAAGLAALAQPLRRERSLPWPQGDGTGLALDFATPQESGPDELPLAPLLVLGPSGWKLDGQPANESSVAEQLRARAREYAILHPDDQARHLLLACAPQTPTAQVRAALHEAEAAGYRSMTLVFDRTQVQPRLIADVEAHTLSGALFRAGAEPGSGDQVLEASRHQRCDQLARALVALRKQAKAVLLTTGP